MANNVLTAAYPSVSAIVAEIDQKPVRPGNARAWDFQLSQGNPADPARSAWLGLKGTMSQADLRRRFAVGDPADVERLRREVSKVEVPPIKTVRRRGQWADQGDTFDRDRLYGGNLDCFRTARRQQVTGITHVRIVAPVGENSQAAGDALFYSAAQAAALGEALVTAGYEVEILAACYLYGSSEDYRTNVVQFVTVKDYEAPLALAPLLTVMSAPCFRTAFFASIILTGDRAGVDIRRGLGSVTTFDPDLVPPAPAHVHTIILPNVQSPYSIPHNLKRALDGLEHRDDQVKAENAPGHGQGAKPAEAPPVEFKGGHGDDRPTPAPPKKRRGRGRFMRPATVGDTVYRNGRACKVLRVCGPTDARYGCMKLRAEGSKRAFWVDTVERRY